MAFDRFLIAPLNTGLQTDLKRWLIPEDAFARLNNAYVFRGRVRKRFGSDYTGTGWPNTFMQPFFSRLRYNLGNTDGSGNKAGTVPGAIFEIGQAFSIGTQVFTVSVANGALLASSGTGTGTYNTATGAYTFTGAAATTAVFFYPSQPVQGLWNIESSVVNDNPSIAFDTQFAYLYNGTWEYSPGSGPWHGDDTNFFWAVNWQGSDPSIDMVYVSNFFVVNPNGAGNANDDFIWRYQPSTATWTQMIGANGGAATDGIYFNPAGGAPYTGPFVVTARIILPFKNHLVLLNTIENDGGTTLGTNSHFPARARYSFFGDPLAVNAWYEINAADNMGNVGEGGGFLDASTEEEIIGAEFIKDRLIVYFENSTWELVWTGNGVFPFAWQKINTELGSDSTFSTIPFDKDVLAIGNVGVHACNGSNVFRIDGKIPDEIFSINKEADEIVRVVGIRDYYTEMVYWTFPDGSATKYPNKVLVYNYQNQSWAFNDDTITFLGYFEQQTDVTWQEYTETWEESDETWTSGVVEANFRQIIGGNQHGFVYLILPDRNENQAVMQITNMTAVSTTITLTIIDHTLTQEDYIAIENLQGVTLDREIYKVNSTPTANTITIIGTLTGTYTGGGVVARVSNIDILSKQWNPYIGRGRNFYLARIDFCVDRTENGEVTVDYYPSDSEQSMLLMGNGGTQGTGANMGNGVLETRPYDPIIYPFEQVQDRLWHPIYFQTDGQTIQIRIYMNKDQMLDSSIARSGFVLEGLILHTQATSARLQ